MREDIKAFTKEISPFIKETTLAVQNIEALFTEAVETAEIIADTVNSNDKLQTPCVVSKSLPKADYIDAISKELEARKDILIGICREQGVIFDAVSLVSAMRGTDTLSSIIGLVLYFRTAKDLRVTAGVRIPSDSRTFLTIVLSQIIERNLALWEETR